MKNAEIMRELVQAMVDADDKQTGYQRCKFMLEAAIRRLADLGMSEEMEVAGYDAVDGDLSDDADRLQTAFTASLRALADPAQQGER